jgi:hypothetical protein
MSAFNPKMIAHDVAKGLASLNPASLKKYSPGDLKALLTTFTAVQREIRSKQIPQENTMEIKEKNRHLQNVSRAIAVIIGHAKHHHIPI